MSVLCVENLSFRYARASEPVLHDVTAGFERGTMYALMGPSGSGKSTLLSLIGLVLRPELGDIRYQGADAWHHVDALRRTVFAWVLQNSACLDARTAVDNVALGLMAQGTPTALARCRALEALSQIGLAARVEARARDLSGGELQRVSVARALLSGRPVILADEPTGQLDASNSAMVASALHACAEADRVVIVATHDPSVANQCDVVLTLENGAIAGEARPSQQEFDPPVRARRFVGPVGVEALAASV